MDGSSPAERPTNEYQFLLNEGTAIHKRYDNYRKSPDRDSQPQDFEANTARLHTHIQEAMSRRVHHLREHGTESIPYAFGMPNPRTFQTEYENLVRKNGYEIVESDPASSLVKLRKDRLMFLVKQHSLPSTNGIGGFSRLSKLSVHEENASEGAPSREIMNYDRQWNVVPTEAPLLEQIDKFVATFG